MSIGRWTWNIAEGTVDWSPEVLAIYGLADRDRPTLDRFTDCVVEEDRTRVMAAVSRTLATGRAGHTIYFRIRRPDGAVRHIMSRARFERTEDGRPAVLAGIDVDLSDDDFAVDTLSRAGADDTVRTRPLVETASDAPDPYSVAMRERDDLLAVLDAMPVMITLYDPGLDFVLVNKALEDITGWPRSETEARTLMEAAYPDPAYRAEVAAFMERCEGWKEITMRTADGRDVPTCWANVRLSDKRRIGIGLDLSAQEDLQRTLSAAETRLRLAQEIAQIGTFEWDIAHGINRWSPELERLYGLGEGGFGGSYEAWAACLHPDDLPGAEAAVRRSFESGRLETEWRVVRPDGEIVWTEARALVERDANGAPLRMIGVNLDVSDRKRLEEALRDEARAARERADEFEALGAAAPIGIALFDSEFRFLWCNDWLAVLNRRPLSEVAGRSIDEVLGHSSVSAPREMQPRLLAGEGPLHREISVSDPATGESRIFASVYTPLADEDGRVTRFLGIVREVTERKRAEEFRELALQELAHRVKNIFAVVQALASRTFADEEAGSAEAFRGRLGTLAAAHELLLSGDSPGADLRDLARDTLAAFTHGDRLSMEGPALTVSGRAAQMLALALHELATNAVKYGALSRPEGRVDLYWRRVTASGGECCELFWRERDGPEIGPPGERGFGHLMIERLLARDLKGKVDLRFPPEGAECDIRWSL